MGEFGALVLIASISGYTDGHDAGRRAVMSDSYFGMGIERKAPPPYSKTDGPDYGQRNNGSNGGKPLLNDG
jgi:hypothetical protein